MSMHPKLTEGTDYYDLPLQGKEVSRCFVDYAFGLQFFEDDNEMTLRIEGAFTLEANSGRSDLHPNDPGSLCPALSLVRKIVDTAKAYKNGNIEVIFQSGIRLTVQADSEYEAWEFSGPQGLLLVSEPGGGLAVWQPA